MTVMSVVLVAIFSLLTVERNRDFRSDRALLEASVLDWPESYNHWLELARLEAREGNNERARELYRMLDWQEESE